MHSEQSSRDAGVALTGFAAVWGMADMASSAAAMSSAQVDRARAMTRMWVAELKRSKLFGEWILRWDCIWLRRYL